MPISNVQTFKVPYTFLNSSKQAWRTLEDKILRSPSKVIILLWEGRGGYVESGLQFKRFLETCHKYVIIRLIGPSESMHALSACFGNQIEFNQGFLMFHLRAGDHNIPDLSSSSKAENTRLMESCVRKGVITEHDIQTVNNDQELYVYPGGYKTVRPDSRWRHRQ